MTKTKTQREAKVAKAIEAITIHPYESGEPIEHMIGRALTAPPSAYAPLKPFTPYLKDKRLVGAFDEDKVQHLYEDVAKMFFLDTYIGRIFRKYNQEDERVEGVACELGTRMKLVPIGSKDDVLGSIGDKVEKVKAAFGRTKTKKLYPNYISKTDIGFGSSKKGDWHRKWNIYLHHISFALVNHCHVPGFYVPVNHMNENKQDYRWWNLDLRFGTGKGQDPHTERARDTNIASWRIGQNLAAWVSETRRKYPNAPTQRLEMFLRGRVQAWDFEAQGVALDAEPIDYDRPDLFEWSKAEHEKYVERGGQVETIDYDRKPRVVKARYKLKGIVKRGFARWNSLVKVDALERIKRLLGGTARPSSAKHVWTLGAGDGDMMTAIREEQAEHGARLKAERRLSAKIEALRLTKEAFDEAGRR